MDADNSKPPTAEPSMSDIFNLLQNCASKSDLGEFTSQIKVFAKETSTKINSLEARTDRNEHVGTENSNRIEALEASVECLKQEQLKNNFCISGVPTTLIKDNNTADIVIAIAKTLGVELSSHHFTSYALAKSKLIIVQTYNIRHKQLMLNKIRVKKSLMVEEAFETVKSNSQIYLNDHLTPYFSGLYLMARKAKKDGKIASASSYGGKIRARKSLNDAPVIITTQKQLTELIDQEDDSCGELSDSSVQYIGSETDRSTASHTSPSHKQSTSEKNNNVERTSDKKIKAAQKTSSKHESSREKNSNSTRTRTRNHKNNNHSDKAPRKRRNSSPIHSTEKPKKNKKNHPTGVPA